MIPSPERQSENCVRYKLFKLHLFNLHLWIINLPLSYLACCVCATAASSVYLFSLCQYISINLPPDKLQFDTWWRTDDGPPPPPPSWKLWFLWWLPMRGRMSVENKNKHTKRRDLNPSKHIVLLLFMGLKGELWPGNGFGMGWRLCVCA